MKRLLVAGLVLLAPVIVQAQTPTPRGIAKLWYDGKHCKHDGEWVRCKHAIIEFRSISARGALPASGTGEKHEFIAPQHPDGDAYEYHYFPDKCSPLPMTKYFVCRDVYWRPVKLK